jgi:hypothetical protein
MGTTKQLSRRIAPGVFPESQRWDSSALFAANEPGVDFAGIDPSILFQDAAGRVPVTAPGQPVGLVLDKSQGLLLGAELTPALTYPLVVMRNGVDPELIANTQTSIVTGKQYKIEIDVFDNVGTAPAIMRVNDIEIGGGMARLTAGVNGTVSFIFQANQTGNILVKGANTVTDLKISRFSVRELAGNHASQATAASRPIYGVVPKGGRRNLFERTEEVDNAYWTKTGVTVTANSAVSPTSGFASADTLVENTALSNHGITRAYTSAAGNHTASFYAKAGDLSFAEFSLDQSVSNLYAIFNLASPSVVITDGVTATITSVGSGWVRCTVTANLASGTRTLRMRFSNLSNTFFYTGNGSRSVDLTGLQLEASSTVTNYQRIVTSIDITEAGAPTCHYLQFDGVDDWLSTAAIDFSGTDKMSVFAGVRKLSDAAQGTLVELTNNSTNAGAFSLLVGNNTSTRRVAWSIASPQDLLGTADQAGVVSLIPSANLDRSGANAAASITPRINGLTPTSSEVIDGNATGNFANAILYLGRRGGTTLPFNGLLFGLVARGVLSSTAEIRQAEKLLARRTSEVTLP